MSNNELLTDDYVAGLLSQEANDCSLKYSAMGMDAYQQEKKPTNMMKPNTRFLRHIIKDTDTHNRNLLAKEAAESRARLRDLERTGELKRRKTNPNLRDIRLRQMGDIHAILGGKRRSRDEDESSAKGRDAKDREESARSSKKDRDLTHDRRDDRKHHGRLSENSDRHGRAEGRPRRDEQKRSQRLRSRDSGSEDDRRRQNRRRRDRSASPRRRRRSQSPRDRKRTHNSKHRHRSPVEYSKSASKRTMDEDDNDSDPVDDLIGPAPPPRRRGRGVLGSSGIDRRFSESYDPRTDVQMVDGDDNATAGSGNWDDAVEAFRDRQKLKQHQEERLRAAGFANEHIQRATATATTTGSGNVEEQDFKWSKAGEKREWDRGKDGDIEGGVLSFDDA